MRLLFFFFFQAEDGIRDLIVTGVQTCALPISVVAGVDVVAVGKERERVPVEVDDEPAGGTELLERGRANQGVHGATVRRPVPFRLGLSAERGLVPSS